MSSSDTQNADQEIDAEEAEITLEQCSKGVRSREIAHCPPHAPILTATTQSHALAPLNSSTFYSGLLCRSKTYFNSVWREYIQGHYNDLYPSGSAFNRN